MTSYWTKYVDAISRMNREKFNLSTAYKQFWLLPWFIFFFGGVGCAVIYNWWRFTFKKSTLPLILIIATLWLSWDMYPVMTINNGSEFQNWSIFFYDAFYASFGWLLLTAFFFNLLLEPSKKNNYLFYFIYFLGILSVSIFFYKWYTYDREHTEYNLLVKYGDKLYFDKMCDLVDIRKLSGLIISIISNTFVLYLLYKEYENNMSMIVADPKSKIDPLFQ